MESLVLVTDNSLILRDWWWTVDSFGNIVVADSRNHRLCLFTNKGKFLCKVGLSPEASRPSGVVLDSENRELYVLNLWGKNAMIKYRIK